MKILEVEFYGSRIILYCADVNLTLLSHHQTPSPSSSFSPVPVCCKRIFLMTWSLKAKTTPRLASTFTSHGILKILQFPITTSCYFFLKWVTSRVIYAWSYFSKEDVSTCCIKDVCAKIFRPVDFFKVLLRLDNELAWTSLINFMI